MVYLLSQPVNSGKTTQLLHWVKETPSVAGILAPDIENQRWLMDITSQECRKLSLDITANLDKAIIIGRYAFNADTFAWARKNLKKAFLERPRWLVFDEIGYLELSGSGLEPMVRTLLEKNRKSLCTSFLWVVRDQLRSDIIDLYQLSTKEWCLWQNHKP